MGQATDPGRPRSVRALARDALVAVVATLTAPLWLLARLGDALGDGGRAFATGSELLSLAPGRVGIFLRRGYYRMTLEACAVDCGIGFGTLLAHRAARVGPGVYVGARCTIGRAIIEEHATIGSNVDILSGRHQHRFDDSGRPIQEQGGTYRPVRIGRNSWIGNGAIVMADVGANCVIGAGSVVVRPIPPGAVAVGNPATVKKRRPGTPEPDLSAPDGVESAT